jgi:hypothetical protein
VTKKTRKFKKQEEKKTHRIILFIDSGMFHSEEEHSRNVDLISELQHSYGSTTTTPPPSATTLTNTFELGQISSVNFDSIEFDFDYDFGRGDSWGTNSSTCFPVGEPQSFTTFTSEDKWPI